MTFRPIGNPYFEYIYKGELTPEFEEKTKLLLDSLNNGNIHFSIGKYYDEIIINDKKSRTIILYSNYNVVDYLYNNFFKDCKVEIEVYQKQRIM